MSDTVAAEPQSPPEASGGQRRLLLMVGGAAVVLVLGLAAYFLFLSGGGEEEFEPIPSAADAAAEQPEKDKGNGKKDDEQVPDEVDTDFQVGRDPFAPLAVEEVVADPVATDEGTDTDTDTSTDTGTSTGGGSGGNPAPAPTPAPTATEDPEPEVTSYKVTLKSVDVAKNSAVIEVNGKRYQVKVKELFTNSNTGPFKLTRVGELPSGKASATIVFGSDAPVEIVQKETEVFKVG
jgi:hypothetical protein